MLALIITSLFLVMLYISITEEIKFNNFKNRLFIGVELYNVYYMIDDEFDEGTPFKITITQLGDKQVKVVFQDGSTARFDIRQLYYENWKFIYEL